MKKYCENRKLGEFTCAWCGCKSEKPQSELNRNEKLGRKNFCSISCAMAYRNEYNVSEKAMKQREVFGQTYGGIKGDMNPKRLKMDELSPFRETFHRAKTHSTNRKVPREFTITLEDLKQQWDKQNGRCAYTNVKLELPYSGKECPPLTRQASLDRIDSSKGYVPGNIQFVCSCINLLKSTLTDLEVKQFLKEISSYTSTFVEDQTISSSELEVFNSESDAQAGN